jgi:hypothetical protein
MRSISARIRTGRACHSPSTHATVIRPWVGRIEVRAETAANARSLIAVAACSRAMVHSLAAHSSPTRCWVGPISSTMTRCAGTPSSSRPVTTSTAPYSSPSPTSRRK